MTRRHPNVVHPDEVTPRAGPTSGRLRSQGWALGRAAGSTKIGCTLWEVAPGCAAFPFHWHAANEEALIVISGQGSLRIGDDEVTVGPGDYLAFPPGPERAHQLLNTGDGPLRYYALSTMKSPEVVGYPDSKKVAASVGTWEKPVLRAIFFEEDQRGYMDREPLATDVPDDG